MDKVFDFIRTIYGIDWNGQMMMIYVAHIPFWIHVVLQVILVRFALIGMATVWNHGKRGTKNV